MCDQWQTHIMDIPTYLSYTYTLAKRYTYMYDFED